MEDEKGCWMLLQSKKIKRIGYPSKAKIKKVKKQGPGQIKPTEKIQEKHNAGKQNQYAPPIKKAPECLIPGL